MFWSIIQTCLPIKRAMFLFKLLIPLFALGLVPLNYACEQKIRISAAKDWPPYSYINNGGFSGLDIDIIEMILSDINLCWEYVSFPSSSRAFQEFKKDNIDLIFAASYTSPRRGFSEFSVAYRTEFMQLFSHQDFILADTMETGKTKVIPEFLEKSITAINRGSVYGAPFSKFKAQCPDCVVEMNASIARFRLLKYKRVNFVIEDLLTGAYLIKNSKEIEGHVKATRFNVRKDPVHYMLRPGMFSESKLQAFNLAIIKNKQNIKKITDKYYQALDVAKPAI